ncbi:MAG TPA: hypothetical protein VK728_05640 [Candidatus Sulfotelmatobacter sp.]|nr:hypothetical protein [Candidatus Sulfotelmatobacter sp.]
MFSNPDISDITGSDRAFNVSHTAIQCQVVTTLQQRNLKLDRRNPEHSERWWDITE